MMRFPLLLPFFGLSALSLASKPAEDEFSLPPAKAAFSTATLHAWPLSSPSPTPLGKATYSTSTLVGNLELFPDPSKGEAEEELVRVGVVAEDGTWSGSVTTRRLLKDGAVTMRVDAAAAGRVWFVEAHPREEAAPKVTVVKATPGVMPELNKPIVLTADGKIPVPQVEKTLLQKYWWVLLAGVFLLISGGGGGE